MEVKKAFKYYTDKKYIKFLYKCFYDLHNVLVENNIMYFASGGTLLGAVRHKGIIQWDDDVDLEISYKDVPMIFKLKDKLKKLGYKIVKHSESENKIDWIKINSIKKINGRISSIDLFPIYIEDKRTHFVSEYTADIWPKAYHNIKDLFPLQQLKFGSGIVFCPKNPSAYLNRSYGNSWSKIGYITMDQDHMMLDKPIKVQTGDFKPGKEYADGSYQIRVNKNDHILTGIGNTFYINQ